MSSSFVARCIAVALVFSTLTGCSGGTRCKSDVDCKGNRVCQNGECAEPASALPAQNVPGAAAQPGQPGQPPATPQPPAAPQPAAPPPGPQGQLVAPPTDACVTPPPQNRNGILRTDPSLDAPEVVQVPRGTPIQVIGESGLFYRVMLPNSGHRGWMNRNAITFGACP